MGFRYYIEQSCHILQRCSLIAELSLGEWVHGFSLFVDFRGDVDLSWKSTLYYRPCDDFFVVCREGGGRVIVLDVTTELFHRSSMAGSGVCPTGSLD